MIIKKKRAELAWLTVLVVFIIVMVLSLVGFSVNSFMSEQEFEDQKHIALTSLYEQKFYLFLQSGHETTNFERLRSALESGFSGEDELHQIMDDFKTSIGLINLCYRVEERVVIGSRTIHDPTTDIRVSSQDDCNLQNHLGIDKNIEFFIEVIYNKTTLQSGSMTRTVSRDGLYGIRVRLS